MEETKQHATEYLESLPAVCPPYLPRNTSGKEYTLVLDMDETLIHYYDFETDDTNCS